tara:strand:+ start:320 stop:532 length:213 start_codon:yes stop_codon:yes gene_type:complete
MFYEVRISDAEGKIKRKIGSSELNKNFWDKINENEEKHNGVSQKNIKLSLHKKLKEMYPHLYEPVFNFNH